MSLRCLPSLSKTFTWGPDTGFLIRCPAYSYSNGPKRFPEIATQTLPSRSTAAELGVSSPATKTSTLYPLGTTSLLGSGFRAVRGTHPPDVLVPAFCASAMGTSGRAAMAASMRILKILIDTPPQRFGVPRREYCVDPILLPRSRGRSTVRERTDEGNDVPDVIVAKPRAPGRHGRVLADGGAALLDHREQVLVRELIHQPLDREVADVWAEGLGLAAPVLAVTAGAVLEEEYLASCEVVAPRGTCAAHGGESEGHHEERERNRTAVPERHCR